MNRLLPRTIASRIVHSARVARQPKPVRAPWPTRTLWIANDPGHGHPIHLVPVTLRAFSWDRPCH